MSESFEEKVSDLVVELTRQRNELNRLICDTYDALTLNGCDLSPCGIYSMPDRVRALVAERDEARDNLEFRRELYRVQENYLEQARKERAEALEVLREIAEASHFDNIGNWARSKAKEALTRYETISKVDM